MEHLSLHVFHFRIVILLWQRVPWHGCITCIIPYSGKVWRVLNLAIWNLSAIGAHAIINIGKFLIWWSLPNLPNCQIKTSPKFPALVWLSIVKALYVRKCVHSFLVFYLQGWWSDSQSIVNIWCDGSTVSDNVLGNKGTGLMGVVSTWVVTIA